MSFDWPKILRPSSTQIIAYYGIARVGYCLPDFKYIEWTVGNERLVVSKTRNARIRTV